MTKLILTADNYADIIAKYLEIKAARRTEAEMWTVHGYHHDATNAAIARHRDENDGLIPAPIPEETFTLTKAELEAVAVKVGADTKAADLKEEVLVKSGVAAKEPVELKEV